MLRRRVALLLIGLAPALTACPAQPGATASPSSGGAPAAPTPTAPAPANWAGSMLGSLNAQRAQAGVAPLALCGTLNTAAQRHSDDQASRNSMTHTGADGSTLGDRAGRAGYVNWTALGENVAYGYTAVDAVMSGWMNSAGHRANILNGTYTHVGVGRASSAGGTVYWTQDFGRSGNC